ncbi:protein translocase subunit yidC [Psychromonas ingrahamii 37]|uniref:Membrane protein insertase YidC n=1 Tax=Psychromonas ingrahamii (strain DSM 17664 / CCUG 51855 / 37) TaxID=357804 RepID=YIDC_PSYIN|nr:membrane protein insertase YidC [Psychromonas ingrahamii]A1T0M9.1 RecName: Full=Membrane protein insertase YidC; AltName: Full=Foldase YidC; AltName: Full=Membrane integrase YidC; AltName: Full=Membrane protein YidC [Psychromonas ingrahamii 37]ABM05294.1 protein translocase subunit yidC [Psychromonas ingrahamii 37]
MESQRNLLLLALLFVSFLLYTAWVEEKTPQVAPQVQTEQVDSSVPASVASSANSANLSDGVPNSPQQSSTDATSTELPASQSVTIANDELRLTISLVGGDIIKADLLQHDATLDSDTPYRLLDSGNGFTYIAQSGLIGQGPDANKNGRPLYDTTDTESVLADGQAEVSTMLHFVDADGNIFIKTFTLKRGEYVTNVAYQIENKTDSPLNVQLYAQLRETLSDDSGSMVMPVYRGGAFSTTETRYEKYSFSDMQDGPLQKTTEGGWVAMLQHYFVSAWIPSPTDQNVLYSNIIQDKEAAIGFKAPSKTIAPQSVAELETNLWVGPKIQEEMALVAKNLDLTVDYGWLWFIAQPLFKLLLFFQGIVGNWGVAIILITFTVKGALYPLTKAQYTSMAKMRLLQPKIKELREQFGEDRQKVSKAMMELYKKEKVNPLGGCFPILLQMPIFIALYWSLMESVELRHAPFMLWIQDLSVQDPYYILPILMGVSMFFIQKMSPTTVQDPMQQKVMQFMPVIFTFFFLWFPAGLVLYWLMSNVVTLIQQTLIYRSFEKKGLHQKEKEPVVLTKK